MLTKAEEKLDIGKKAEELVNLKKSLESNPSIGPLIGACQTIDQAKAVMVYADCLQ